MRKILAQFAIAVLMVVAVSQCATAQAAAEYGTIVSKGAPVGNVGEKINSVVSVVAAQTGAATGSAQSSASQAPQVTPTAQPGQQAQTTEAPATEASAPLRVLVGKSLLINTQDRLKRVSVTDPTVADALVVTPTQVLVHGRQPGEVSLLLWDERERSRSFDLRVDADITAVQEQIKRIFPQEKVEVSASRTAVVLSGHVATKEDADRLGLIAGAYTKNVVNVLTFGPVGAQEVLLEVKFAEVNRTALTALGLNIFSTGATNTIGTISTQQFGSFGQQKITDVFTTHPDPRPDIVTPIAGPGKTGFKTEQTINDVLNLFLFRPDIHLGAVIKALQQKNLLQILAEPNLIAVNGKEASFLAGGEFPFPVVTPAQGFNQVTIQFKEFGVRLKFTPQIMPNGNIHLNVSPEVSALDFTNALTLSGFLVPALSTRRANTEFELQDGQSFVIAGLLDNRLQNVGSKVPGLGDIPIIGNLFKSKNFQKSQTELLVLVTARRIQPSAQPAPFPTFPEKFMPKTSEEVKPGGGTK